MKNQINFKRLLLASLLVMIINMIIGNLLYMNPYVSGLYAQFSGHLSVKPMEDFGGTANWVLLTLSFSFIYDLFLIFIFISVYNYLPGNAAVKGLLFGVTIAAIKAIPEAFNQFMIFKYPGILIIVQLVNTIIGIILFGIYMSIIFTKLKVFTSSEVNR